MGGGALRTPAPNPPDGLARVSAARAIHIQISQMRIILELCMHRRTLEQT